MNIKVPTIRAGEPRYWRDLKAWCQSVARKLNQNEKRINTLANKPPKPHPHQLLKTFDPNVVSDTVTWKCRAALVYIDGTEHENDTYAAGDLFNDVIDTAGRLDDPVTFPTVSVYAMIDTTNGDWVYDTNPADAAYDGRIKIEVARKEGAIIRQKMHSHIVISEGEPFLPARFQPTINYDTNTVDIAVGSWFGYDYTEVTAGNTAIGDSINKYIVGTIDNATTPTTFTVTATNLIPAGAALATKRHIATLVFDGADLDSVIRHVVGDIHTSSSGGSVAVDNFSIDFDGASQLQWRDYDTQPSGIISPADTLGFSQGPASTLLYNTVSDLLSYIESNIDLSGIIDQEYVDDLMHNHEDHTFNTDDHNTTGVDRYIIHDGTAARNNMSGVIGDNAGTPKDSISPNLRQLLEADGTAVAVDWAEQELGAGFWTVTDTTVADNGTGALVITTGGIYSGGGGYFDKGSASDAGYFFDGTSSAAFANGTLAGLFGRAGSGQVELCGGGYAINVSIGDYYHQANQGQTIIGWWSGGLNTGIDVATYQIRAIPAGGGAPIDIEVLGRLV